MKSYVFDIDGTICYSVDGEYEKAGPLLDRIELINKLYKAGNNITFFTARGMRRNNNDRQKAEEQFYSLTKKQLDDWGVKYHNLFLGKPQGDIYVDDKGCLDNDFFEFYKGYESD